MATQVLTFQREKTREIFTVCFLMVKEKKENPLLIFNLDCFANQNFFFFNHNFGLYYFPPPSHSEELLLKTMFYSRITIFFKVVEEGEEKPVAAAVSG